MSKDHYLPQFYLRGFQDENKKLHCCRTQYDTYKSRSTAEIYYTPDLNNIDLGEKGRFNLEDTFFRDKDNYYAKAFADMKDKYSYMINRMPLQVKADVVEFVLGLYWRVPGGLQRVIDVLENEGLITSYVDPKGYIYTNKDIPNIIKLLKEDERYQKVLLPILYNENIEMHDWINLDNKFFIFETHEPLLIGDIPFVPLKSDNKRGKILDEFVIPLDKNHILIYTNKRPNFLETNLLYYFNLCVIDGASERISCCDENYLRNMISQAKPIIARLNSMGIKDIKYKLLAPLIEFESGFQTFEDFKSYIMSPEYKGLATPEAIERCIRKYRE